MSVVRYELLKAGNAIKQVSQKQHQIFGCMFFKINRGNKEQYYLTGK